MMARRTFGSGLRYNGMPIWSWIGLFSFALALVGAIEYFETERLIAATDEPFNLHLSGYANLFLAGAAVLYVGHTWFRSIMIGRLASSAAAVGAASALIALALRWLETSYLQRPGHVAVDGLHETIALFNALTVVIYLVMERIYRNRSAGAFVMAIVLAAVVFQAWLSGAGGPPVGGALRNYWIHAHVLGNIVGYAAFAVSAAMAIAIAMHALAPNWRAKVGLAPGASVDMQRLDRLMNQAVMLGFATFTVATALGVLRAYQESSWAWDGKETWALAAWLAYASYFWLRHVRKWSGTRMAWWTTACFGVALVCLFGAATHSFVRTSQSAPTALLSVGRPFPALVLQASPDPDVRIDSLRGRMVVLNVWATWCPPCRKEMPDLERLSKILDPLRFTVIGLSTDQDRWAAELFLLQTGVTFKNYFDTNGTIARNLKFPVYPETFLIAPDGILVMRMPGLREWDSPDVVAELEQAYRQWQAGPGARASRRQ